MESIHHHGNVLLWQGCCHGTQSRTCTLPPFKVFHSDSRSSAFYISESLCVKLVVALICIVNSLFCKCALLLCHLVPLRPVELYLSHESYARSAL